MCVCVCVGGGSSREKQTWTEILGGGSLVFVS